MRMLPTGKVEVVTGSSAHGQGHETAWSQIVADQLGVAFDDVEVLHGDTRTSVKGLDTYGSRSLAVGGIALYQRLPEGDREGEAGRRAHARMRRRTTSSSPTARSRCAARPARARRSRDCALAVFAAHDLPDGIEANLDAEAVYDPDNFSFPHGTHLCAVEVDTETGKVEDPQVRRRRRRRSRHQPDDRRGSGARRRRPGHRAGAVRGGRLRRRRATCSPARSSTTRSPSAADLPRLRDRPDGDPGAGPSARHEGRRRGGHDRVDAGRGQRGRRRAAAAEASMTSRCRVRPSGCGGQPTRVPRHAAIATGVGAA